MTPAQFDALAQLAGLKAPASREAVRLALMEGLSKATAARRTGITQQGVGDAARRAVTALELARIAAVSIPHVRGRPAARPSSNLHGTGRPMFTHPPEDKNHDALRSGQGGLLVPVRVAPLPD